MYMRVGRELLTPGMQNAEEADFCTEVLGIAGHFEKSFRTGAKQETVEDLLVLQDQRGQMTRKREDNMDVTRWEKLLATCCEPAIARSCLTLRAVPWTPCRVQAALRNMEVDGGLFQVVMT